MKRVRDLDPILDEMLAVADELAHTADLAERAALHDRQHQLRAEAAVARGPDVAALSDAELERRLVRCEHQLRDVFASHFDVASVAGASGIDGGLDPAQTLARNREIDAARGRDALEAELHELLAEIARRR